jgi:hypothetical protein
MADETFFLPKGLRCDAMGFDVMFRERERECYSER